MENIHQAKHLGNMLESTHIRKNFERDLFDPKLRRRHRKMIVEAIGRLLEARPAKA